MGFVVRHIVVVSANRYFSIGAVDWPAECVVIVNHVCQQNLIQKGNVVIQCYSFISKTVEIKTVWQGFLEKLELRNYIAECHPSNVLNVPLQPANLLVSFL